MWDLVRDWVSGTLATLTAELIVWAVRKASKALAERTSQGKHIR